MTAIRRLVHRRKWTAPLVTDPLPGVIYEPRQLGLPFSSCQGVMVGSCVRHEPWDGASAHAHILDPYQNFICVKAAYLLYESDVEWMPRRLMWHEYAHILAGPEALGEDHDPAGVWAGIMRDWGLHPSRWS